MIAGGEGWVSLKNQKQQEKKDQNQRRQSLTGEDMPCSDKGGWVGVSSRGNWMGDGWLRSKWDETEQWDEDVREEKRRSQEIWKEGDRVLGWVVLYLFFPGRV